MITEEAIALVTLEVSNHEKTALLAPGSNLIKQWLKTAAVLGGKKKQPKGDRFEGV